MGGDTPPGTRVMYGADRHATWIVWRADMTLAWSWLPIQPATNGSDAATIRKPTRIFAGKPTANTFSCGITRETTPKPASVMISAIRTGAAISTAETKID